MSQTANKGEWSEYYAFLKLLADRRIFSARPDLEVNNDSLPILKIVREEKKGKMQYDLKGTDEVLVLNEVGAILAKVKYLDVSSKLSSIMSKIVESSGAFVLSEAENLMQMLHNSNVKASSVNKSDLTLQILDVRANNIPVDVGFSIKSQIGGASTLLNASQSTNFIFRVENISCTPDEINAIDTGPKDRIRRIHELGGNIVFSETQSPVFEENLKTIDTVFSKMLAEVVLEYFLGNGTTVEELCARVGTGLVIESFNLDHRHFDNKIKFFLYSVALGMQPATRWDGNAVATGGYIIVKENGELACFHAFNADNFRQYLFLRTKLETPSESRHKFGRIYEENGDLYIRLNLQIRFID